MHTNSSPLVSRIFMRSLNSQVESRGPPTPYPACFVIASHAFSFGASVKRGAVNRLLVCESEVRANKPNKIFLKCCSS